jgi:hypothetical protein
MSSINIESNLTTIEGGFYKLNVVTTSEDMPQAVFAIEVLPASRDPLAVPYRFSHVCKLTDLIELPEGQDPEYSYFRTNDIEMIFDTLNLALETNQLIRSDINKLVVAYNNMNDPEVTGTTITIGGYTEGEIDVLNRVYYNGDDVNG